jgi:hypothetical protein
LVHRSPSGDPAALCSEPHDPATEGDAMARSKDMQQALDIVAGRQPASTQRTALSGLERTGLFLWIGVGLMVVGLGALFALS